MQDIIKRLRQFSTGSGLAAVTFIAITLFDIGSEQVQAGVGIITAILNFYDVVRDEKA